MASADGEFSALATNTGWGQLRRFADVAVLAVREEFGPRFDVGMPLDQRPPLTFRRAAPDTELHLVVKRIGEAFGDDGTVPADDCRLPLRRSANEELVGIG